MKILQKVKDFFFCQVEFIRDKKNNGLWSVNTVTGRELEPIYTSKCCKANTKASASFSEMSLKSIQLDAQPHFHRPAEVQHQRL